MGWQTCCTWAAPGGTASCQVYSAVTRSVIKWQSEDEINAAIRELAREVRALRVELKALWSAAPPSTLNGVVGSETARTTQPIDEDRKLRPIPQPGKRP